MTINGAHWHLLVNHFPIIGSLMATLVLGYGLFRHNEAVIKLGFGLFVLISVATAITNQTGESAEHYLESIQALDKQRLHTHEQAATWANVGMYLTGGLSLLALFWKRVNQLTWYPVLVFMLSLVTFGLMVNVGRLGGLIMHQELRSESKLAQQRNALS